MARDAMPPMVVSANRFADIEPFANRLRAADPLKWGAVFPWEFPQDASRQEEEGFLRNWFTVEEVHVQGGAGDKNTPGAGYKFLKQVWYSQAIWNWEHRVPALNDWWWKNAESAGLIHDTSMQKYILDPHVELKTFFQSAELAMYGEKFLRHVVPVIQQTAKARIEDKATPKTKAASSLITRAVAHVPENTSASEPPTAALDGQSDMPDLTKTSSQPSEAKSKMPSPVEVRRPMPQSTLSQVAHPRIVSTDYQPSAEQGHFNRKRGNSFGRRYSNRGGQFQPRQPFYPHDQDVFPTHGYQSVRGMPIAPHENYSHSGPGGPPDFAFPRGRGRPAMAGSHPQFSADFQFPSIDSNRHPATFATPFDGQQPHIVWAPNPLVDSGNESNRHSSGESHRDNGYNGYNFHGGREYHGQDQRGGKNRAFSGDRGRGRGYRGGRSSFGSHGQAPGQDFQRYTSYEYRAHGSTPKARRGSVVSVEKNWRSGSDRPQDHADTTLGENFTPARPNANYAPPWNNMPHAGLPHYQHSFQAHAPPPSFFATERQMQIPPGLPNDPEYHCTKDSIGALCPYVSRLMIFSIPIEHDDDEGLVALFRRFGTVTEFWKLPVPPPRIDSYRPAQRMAFIGFSTPDEARNCLNNKPQTWLWDHRPLRIEVPREYWDATSHRYVVHRAASAAMAPVFEPSFPNSGAPTQSIPAMHHSHDSSSTIRGPIANTPEPQAVSGETTPTASGTSTPKKKNSKHQVSKNKNKNKKANELRAASLAGAAEGKTDVELKHGDGIVPDIAEESNADAMPKKTTSAGNPGLTVNVEKQRSASQSTERQTTSEASFTPIDKVTTKLPAGEDIRLDDREEVPVPTAPYTSPDSTNAQTSTAPPLTPADSASVSLPPDVNTADQLFREHEAKETAASADVIKGDEKPGSQAGDAINTDETTHGKAEEDPLDDSFHTATGSPGSGKSTGDHGAPVETAPEAVPATAASETVPTEQSSQASEEKNVTEEKPLTEESQAASSTQQDPTQYDEGKLKHLSESASLTIDTKATTKSGKRNAAKRSASDGSALTPATAFVTAPNTPSVEQESDKPVTVEDDALAQSKKAEKLKGPPKTESLSMFGKKQAKKPKQQKKATLKGKPKELTDTSRVTTPDPSPNLGTSDAGSQLADDGKEQQEDHSKPAAEEDKKEPTTEHTGTSGPTTPPDLGGTLPPPTQEPPKPRGGSIFSGLGRLFAGSQTQSNPQEKQATSLNPKQSSLTSAKDSRIDLKHEKVVAERVEGKQPDSGVVTPQDNCAPRSLDHGLPDSHSLDDTAPDHHHDDKDAAPMLAGLGIINASHLNDETAAKPKKRKKKPKKKSKKAADSTGEFTPDATPEPEEGRSPFKFTFQAASPQSLRSDHSDTSSHTVAEATPSTGTSSPVARKQPRKLRSDHVLQEKEPQWKNKKRSHRAASGPDESADEEKDNYALEAVDSQTSNSASDQTLSLDVVDTVAGMKIPRTTIWFFPAKTRFILLPTGSNDEQAGDDDTDKNRILDQNDRTIRESDESEIVKESKARMMRLMEEESSRKHGRTGSGAGKAKMESATNNAEGQSSRIEELGKLFPGRTIVLIRPVDESDD